MADPATIGIIATIATVASAAVGAVGSISQGVSQSNAQNYNAQIASNNARTASRVAASREEAQRRASNQILGQQTAAIGEAGVGFGGSAADVQRQSRINAALSALNIRYEGQIQAGNYRSQADLLRYQGDQSLIAGGLGAGSALLSGAADYGRLKGGFGIGP